MNSGQHAIGTHVVRFRVSRSHETRNASRPKLFAYQGFWNVGRVCHGVRYGRSLHPVATPRDFPGLRSSYKATPSATPCPPRPTVTPLQGTRTSEGGGRMYWF